MLRAAGSRQHEIHIDMKPEHWSIPSIVYLESRDDLRWRVRPSNNQYARRARSDVLGIGNRRRRAR